MGNHSVPPEPSNQAPLKQLFWSIVFFLAVFALFSTQLPTNPLSQTIVPYSEIKEEIRNGDVREVTLEASAIVAILRSPTAEGIERHRAITPLQPDPELLPLLEQAGVIISAVAPSSPSLLWSFLPWILIFAFYFWLSRRMTGGGIKGGLPGGISDFLGGRSAKPTKPIRKVTFADVAGQDEAKREVSELVEF